MSVEKKIKVHIVGTHGVPAKYGGFETLADFLCQHLGSKLSLTVYCNAHKYPVRERTYHGASLKYLKIEANGFTGIFYDLFTYCVALFKADIILYLSPVGSGFMTPLKYLTGKKVIVNHGGLNEWEREKLNWLQRKWAKFNHFVASKFADVNIADNFLYQKSLEDHFGATSQVVRYGGDHVVKVPVDDPLLQEKYPFTKHPYAVSVSRAQIDNNIHVVLEAFEKFDSYKIVLVSNWNISEYGKNLKAKYLNHPNMILLDAIYDKRTLDYVRGNAHVYVHSHSRCGTAPSLVEAMCIGNAIVSFDVPTNRETTKNEASYYTDASSLVTVLSALSEKDIQTSRLRMAEIANQSYAWSKIATEYMDIVKSLS